MKKWDIEYSTQYNPEQEYLKAHNISPSFVKTINGTTTYKYQKTGKLFKLLSCFYEKY